MGLVVTFTFALCAWVVVYALGYRSFDGFVLALTILVVGAGTRVLMRRLRPEEPTA